MSARPGVPDVFTDLAGSVIACFTHFMRKNIDSLAEEDVDCMHYFTLSYTRAALAVGAPNAQAALALLEEIMDYTHP